MKIGINSIALFPWILIDARNIINDVLEVGYDFIQLLPSRGISSEVIDKYRDRILYYETAWNPGRPEDLISGIIKNDPLAPKLHDIVIFPDSDACNALVKEIKNKTSATEIVHNFDEFSKNKLLEVSPGLWMDAKEIVNNKTVKDNSNLVIDTYHLVRKPRIDEIIKAKKTFGVKSCLSNRSWQENLEILCSYSSLIHLSPNRDNNELIEFLQGEKKIQLEKMLEYLKNHASNKNFVVETTLGLKGIKYYYLVQELKKLLERTKKILGA